jgi:hypothetical protein
MKFYVSFGMKYKHEKHPILGEINPDGVYVVKASNRFKAREKVFKAIDDKWSFLYSEEEIDWVYFPAGEIGVI